MNLNDMQYAEFKVSDLFIVKYGVNLELNACVECEKQTADSVAFVARTSENNGISAYVTKIDDVIPQKILMNKIRNIREYAGDVFALAAVIGKTVRTKIYLASSGCQEPNLKPYVLRSVLDIVDYRFMKYLGIIRMNILSVRLPEICHLMRLKIEFFYKLIA